MRKTCDQTSTLLDRYINTAYDTVKKVADNMDDINTVADNVDSLQTYLGSSATDPTARPNGQPLQEGDLYYNTTLFALKTYTGGQWITITSTGTVTIDEFVGDGTTVDFALSTVPGTINNTQIFVQGVYQEKDSYTIVGNTVTFSEAPPADYSIEVATYTILSLVKGVSSENQTLVLGQTLVSFTNNIGAAAFHISGKDVDSRRLMEGTDYTIDYIANSITLTDSYPANTEIFLLYEDTINPTYDLNPAFMTRQSFVGDGVTTNFTLDNAPNAGAANTVVTIDGVGQNITTYSAFGSDIVFSEAPPLNSVIEVITIAVTPAPSTISASTNSITLTSGQTIVSLSTFVDRSSFFVNGPDVDGRRLLLNTDYTINVSAQQVTLLESFPAGTIFTQVYYDAGSDAVNADASIIGYDQGGTGAVVTTVETKLRETVSVKDFGAVGDGVTDDTAAIQAALDSCSDGQILCGSKDDTYLCGRLVYSTAGGKFHLKDINFKLANNIDNSLLDIRYADYVFVDNCTFNGNKTNQSKISTANVLLWGCASITIKDSEFKEASYHGCELFKCRNVLVENNSFHDNGKADSAYPADGLMLTIAAGTIRNNTCYMNNTVTGGDNIDGDGIQLGISGSDEAGYWEAATDLLEIVRVEDNLCYLNGRRGIKDQRGNIQILSNTCYGNKEQFSTVQSTSLSNIVYANNIAGQIGDTLAGPCFYIYTTSGTLDNVTVSNNLALGNITVNDIFRFGGLGNAKIHGNIHDGTVTTYRTYGFRDYASTDVYLSIDNDATLTTTGGVTNLYRGAFAETTVTATGSVKKFEDGTLIVEHYENFNPTSGTENVVTLPEAFIDTRFFVSVSTTYTGANASAIAATQSAVTRPLSTSTVGLTFLTTYATAGTYQMSFYAVGRWK